MNEIKYPPGCKDIQVELANDELIRRLKKIQQVFQNMDQTATEKYKELSIFLGCELFLQHDHEDVQLLVACCLADIFRINAPDSPFQDPTNLKNIFIFLANQLKGLKENGNTSFKRYFYLLENLECVKTFLLCQELDDSQEIIAILFDNVFKTINEKTIQKVKTLVFDLLLPLLNESDQISTKVLDILFSRVIEPAKSNNKETYTLALNLLQKGNEHFEYLVQNHLNSISLTSRSNMNHNLTLSSTLNNKNLSNTSRNNSSDDSSILNSSLDNLAGQSSESAAAAGVHGSMNQFISDKLCLIIYELNAIRPALLELVMPQLEYKLKSNDQKERREYTRLLSKMFSEKDSKLARQLPALWEAYLERFSDMNDDIRKICIQHICDFLIQQSSSIKSIVSSSNSTVSSQSTVNNNQILEQIIEQVKSRALDPEEGLRFEVIQEIIKAIKSDSNLITIEILNILKERTLDIKIKVRKQALQGLANLYKKVHAKSNSRKTVQILNWIPTKIMRIYFQDSIDDKLIVERLLNSCIVPYTLGAKEKMAQLYYAFFTFDDYSVLSLVEIMRNRVMLYQAMKVIIELNESTTKSLSNEERLSLAMKEVSQSLMDPVKGMDFIKALLNLFKTNINLKNAFRSFVNVSCTCSKTMHYIQIILNNINSLNTTQSQMARRLIDRMSSLIIDKECLESLIDLVEYKIKQKLTPLQRRMLNKRHKKPTADVKTDSKKTSKSGRKPKSTTSANKRGKAKNADTSDEEDQDNEEEEDEEDNFELDEKSGDEDSEDDLTNPNQADEDDDEDDDVTKTTETSNREETGNERLLLKHIDDDGERGLKLINIILKIHTNYGFANPTIYQKLFTFVNSRKDHVVSSALKILSSYFTQSMRTTYTEEQLEQFNKTNSLYTEKLKYLCKNGKPKQAKFAVYVIFNNFEKSECQTILYELFKDLYKEAELKKAKTFIPCLISLGHICLLVPQLVGKEIKEFISKTIAKELLLPPSGTPLNIADQSSFSGSLKKKSNLKLAGKWCENEDELPFDTRAKIEGVKLLTRWCLGLKSECTSITITLKILTKLIKENICESSSTHEAADTDSQISEAEKSRIRSVSASQLLKLAQEFAFKPLITAEYFHIIAKCIIDPVTNVRDIMIKKLQKGLQSNKLPIYYMSMFALLGFDSNRDRKMKVKKIYTLLIKRMRFNDARQQEKNLESTAIAKPIRILPEMCLPYAVSLLAHNIQIDSLKDDPKVKQIKDCMSVILEPLIENPDSYQIAYIKKVLNKIKISDDGLTSAALLVSSNDQATANKITYQKLYSINKKLCLICEVFLFHLHSKSFSYSVNKEYEFEVKLPTGFYSARDNSDGSKNFIESEIAGPGSSNVNKKQSEQETDKENHIEKHLPSGSKITITRIKRKISIEEKLNENNEESDSEENQTRNASHELSSSNNMTNRSNESKNNSSESCLTPTPSKRNKRNNESNASLKSANDSIEAISASNIENKRTSRRNNASPKSNAVSPATKPAIVSKRNSKNSNTGKNDEQEEEEKENSKMPSQEETTEEVDKNEDDEPHVKRSSRTRGTTNKATPEAFKQKKTSPKLKDKELEEDDKKEPSPKLTRSRTATAKTIKK